MKRKGDVALTGPEIAKVKAFAALGYSDRRIGRELGKSAHTVKKALVTPEASAEVSALKKDLADLYEQRNYEILESVSKQDIDKANLRDKVVSAAICSDKMRLLRDQSNANVNVSVLFEVLELIRKRDDQPYRNSHELQDAPGSTI
jgi:hypothetical protein